MLIDQTPEVSDPLISSLVLFKKFLLAQKPRVVTAAMLQTWLVFTDASFEREAEEIDKAGFGGVLVSPQGKYVKFFSFELKGDDLGHLNPSGKNSLQYLLHSNCGVSCCPVDRSFSMLITTVFVMSLFHVTRLTQLAACY